MPVEFQAQHIPGSVLIPLHELEQRMREVPNSKTPISPRSLHSGTAQRNKVDKLSRTTTPSPASSNSNSIWLAMNPAPPGTRIVMLQIVSRDVVAIHRFLSERD